MSIKREFISNWNVLKIECHLIGVSVKIEFYLRWNETKNGMSPQMECHSKGMSLKTKCHSNFSQNWMSLKMECHSNWNVAQHEMSLKMKYH